MSRLAILPFNLYNKFSIMKHVSNDRQVLVHVYTCILFFFVEFILNSLEAGAVGHTALAVN